MSSRFVKTVKRKFAKDLDNTLNMNFNVDLKEYHYEPKPDNDIDLNKAAASLMVMRSHHLKATEEYKKVLDSAQKDWTMYNSLKSLYEVAYINMKFVELQIINEIFDQHVAALCAHNEADFFYPATVLWKTRVFIVETCRISDTEEFFKHYLFKKPTHDQTWNDHGQSIDLNIKIILAAECLMHRMRYTDMPKFKSLMDLSVEVLESMTCKYNKYDDIKYASTE